MLGNYIKQICQLFQLFGVIDDVLSLFLLLLKSQLLRSNRLALLIAPGLCLRICLVLPLSLDRTSGIR